MNYIYILYIYICVCVCIIYLSISKSSQGYKPNKSYQHNYTILSPRYIEMVNIGIISASTSAILVLSLASKLLFAFIYSFFFIEFVSFITSASSYFAYSTSISISSYFLDDIKMVIITVVVEVIEVVVVVKSESPPIPCVF